ncbi:PKD domain-containing protein [Pengzhenrongella sp.]|jgi:PKD repeat protein|uniref:PKD domain-containing protein n=1 Tax=Pengzhenrongella sp. TaxID=2888820 RepID=UPI002F958BC3
MRTARATASRAIASVATAALLVVGLAVAGPQRPAAADSAPSPGTPVTIAGDGLPTAQINGVAWAQVIVSGTVYVAGAFTTARRAGAAAGTSTVTRADLLAYDLATGNLTSWAPKLNGAAYSIAASADGTRIYVGGDFTQVNGVAQNRFVVLSRSTGARVSGFNPNPNSTVRAIASTSSTIYLGGRFTKVAGNTRNRLAAISATSGALLSWKVSATYQVDALVMSPDKSRLIVGGRFTTLNGVAAPGSGAVSASSGSVQSWAVNKIVTNYGYDSGIDALSTDGTLVYGAGWAFLGHNGGYGNLEGIFAANPSNGALVWLEDCHGDTYGVYAGPATQAVYGVGHPHYCGNIGSFGDSEWRFILAFSKNVVSTIKHNTVSPYYDFYGNPAPANLDFFPKLTGGTYTGTGQAAWSVTGSGSYVTFAGEFLTVGGQGQQGLVRMALAPESLNKLGPERTGSSFQPSASSPSAGTVKLTWPSNWDRDNENLTYKVVRNSATTVYTTTTKSTWWKLPTLSFTNTGLVKGQTYSYKVVVSDPFNNTVTSPSVSIKVSSSSTAALAPTQQQSLTSEQSLTGEQTLAGPSAPAATRPPVADFVATHADLTISVDAAATTDPDGTIAAYQWDFGDGVLATGKAVSHHYASAGTYIVTLTAVDASGASGSTQTTVTVTAPAPTVAVFDTL